MSYITGGHTAQLSPDDTRTAIDTVMYETLEREQQPSYLPATNEMFFKNSPTDSMAFIWDEDSNVGNFEITGEQEELDITNTFIGNQTTKGITKYTKSIPISWEAFKTSQQGKRDAIGRQVGDRARQTRDQEAILNTYGDAFDGNINTTPDGDSLASNSHTTLGGGGQNVDNRGTGALTPDNLFTEVDALASQLAQDGDAGSYVFNALLVPFTLYKTAKEVLNSNLIANSAENNLNIFETDYGQVALKASIFLGSAFNGNANANTSYHLLSDGHMIQRKVLDTLNTDLIEPRFSRTDSWEHRSRFAESHFPGSWSGYQASDGSGG